MFQGSLKVTLSKENKMLAFGEVNLQSCLRQGLEKKV
jgi:hypothetical protein